MENRHNPWHYHASHTPGSKSAFKLTPSPLFGWRMIKHGDGDWSLVEEISEKEVFGNLKRLVSSSNSYTSSKNRIARVMAKRRGRQIVRRAVRVRLLTYSGFRARVNSCKKLGGRIHSQ